MDMYESPSPSGERPLVTATFELPGLRKEDIRIDVLDDHMIVTGDRRQYAASTDAVPQGTRDQEMDGGGDETAAIGEMTESGHPVKEEERYPNSNAPHGHAGYTVREIKRGRFKRVVPLPPGTKVPVLPLSHVPPQLTDTHP